jgi:hypothetical protein
VAQEQSITFLVPAAEAEKVVAAIRANFATALIGRKPHETDSVLLAVTLYAESTENILSHLSALGLDTQEFGPYRPSTGSLSDLIAAIRGKQTE